MNLELKVRIRQAEIKDKDFILSLVPRLAEFGPPPWREPSQIISGEQRALDNALTTNPPKTAIFIAEDGEGSALGFIHLHSSIDFFTLEEHGHISVITVAASGEGLGIGSALMKAGEEWARQQGYRILTLNAFVENHHARGLYQKLGYGEEMIKYLKVIA
jgi:ribosomal protein S18 acetylase RimI-like enzyme